MDGKEEYLLPNGGGLLEEEEYLKELEGEDATEEAVSEVAEGAQLRWTWMMRNLYRRRTTRIFVTPGPEIPLTSSS